MSPTIIDRIHWLQAEYLRLHNREATHLFLRQEDINFILRCYPFAFNKGVEGFNKIMGMFVVPCVTAFGVGILVEEADYL